VLTEHVGHVRYDSRVVNLVESLAIATLGRRCVHAAHALVTYNDRVAQEMQSLAPGVPRVTIRNGVDFERFHPAADDRGRLRRELGWDDRPRVLLVGRMVEKKGVGIAIEAANRLGGAVELVLAGPGQPPRPSPNVRYLGSLSRERIAEVYRACDLFLLPSRGEGFPLAVQEAMASGLPVILAGDPGYVETLRGSGDAVALVEPDVESVVTAIRSLLLRDLRFLGEEATRFARERFGWRAAVEQHLALYRQIISGTTPAR
jgi:glycosyltransferase involved in cell wall biosynthesis